MGMAPKKPTTTVRPDKLLRPHNYTVGDEAHAIVCLLRLDKSGKLRKQFCPEIEEKEWRLDTNLDVMFVAMFHKLQGELTRVRNAPIEKGTKTEKGASLFSIKKRAGRPSKEAAEAEAADRLVNRQWRKWKEKMGKKQRDKKAVAAARAERMKLGTFTARGNAIVGCKETAIVEARATPPGPARVPRSAPVACCTSLLSLTALGRHGRR